MADSPKSRPVLIPPLVKSDASLELVREPHAPRSAEHPHCGDHFLFTPHCSACIHAERTQHAKTVATPMDPSPPSPKPPPRKPKPSRSFGYTDSITPSTLAGMSGGSSSSLDAIDITTLVDILLEV